MMLATSGFKSRSGSVVKAAGAVPKYAFMLTRRMTVASTSIVTHQTFSEWVDDRLMICCSCPSMLAFQLSPIVYPLWLTSLIAVTRKIAQSLELVLEHVWQLSS